MLFNVPNVVTLSRIVTVLMRGPAVHVFDGTIDPRSVPPRPR